MCSVSNQTPVQLQLAFKSANSSYTDVESFLQQPHVKMAPPLNKSKHYSHKLLRAMDPTNATINSSSCNNNQRIVFARASVSTSNTKKSSKLRSKHAVNISSSLDTSFITSNEDIKCIEKESCCRNSLISPHRNLCRKDRKSCHYHQATDTDELLRKVSVQLMRAQNGDVSRRCDKNKIADTSKNWVDNQKLVTLSSAESPKLGHDNDISPTSDDCGQFSGCSTPDHQVSSQNNTIDEDQLRLACEHIIEQQQKAWLAFKRAKRNGRRSLTRQALDIEKHPLKESPLSNTSDNISIQCKNESVSLKASNTCEEGHISSEQFDSGHGSSEEHEIVSKAEWFPSAGNTNSCIPISRPHYRYHMRRQKGHCSELKSQTSLDTVPSPLETATATMKTNPGEQRRSPRDNSSEFKQSSFIVAYSQSTKSKEELLLEANSSSSSPSQFPSYVSSNVCSGLTSCSSSSFSSTVDIQQVMTNCSPVSLEPAPMVKFSTEETLSNHNSSNENNKTPKQALRLREKVNATSLSSSLSSLTPSPSCPSKNSSKKENNKSNVKLYTSLTRSCISCGFIANACSKLVQIRKTISGKTSNILSSTKFSGD